jgi:hypothetical protein
MPEKLTYQAISQMPLGTVLQMIRKRNLGVVVGGNWTTKNLHTEMQRCSDKLNLDFTSTEAGISHWFTGRSIPSRDQILLFCCAFLQLSNDDKVKKLWLQLLLTARTEAQTRTVDYEKSVKNGNTSLRNYSHELPVELMVMSRQATQKPQDLILDSGHENKAPKTDFDSSQTVAAKPQSNSGGIAPISLVAIADLINFKVEGLAEQVGTPEAGRPLLVTFWFNEAPHTDANGDEYKFLLNSCRIQLSLAAAEVEALKPEFIWKNESDKDGNGLKFRPHVPHQDLAKPKWHLESTGRKAPLFGHFKQVELCVVKGGVSALDSMTASTALGNVKIKKNDLPIADNSTVEEVFYQFLRKTLLSDAHAGGDENLLTKSLESEV